MTVHFVPRLTDFRIIPGLTIILLLLAAMLANADVPALKPPCPSVESLNTEMQLRNERLQKLNNGLEHFLAGNPVEDIPLSILFTIDLYNPGAVAKRRVELQRETELSDDERHASDQLLTCALKNSSLHDSAQQILVLQNKITALRLQFLSLPSDQKAALLHPLSEVKAQTETLRQLQEERSKAEQRQKESAHTLANLEQQGVMATDGSMGNFIVAKTELEKARMAINATQIKWLSELERDAAFYQETSEKLAEYGKVLISPDVPAAVMKAEYERTVVLWRTLVDRTLNVVSSRHSPDLPELPGYHEKILAAYDDQPEAKAYRKLFEETEVLKQDLQQKIQERMQEGLDRHYRVLLQSGEIRSLLINQLLNQGDYAPLRLSLDLLHDIRREISIVPYRWSATFYLRILDIRHFLNENGWKGIQKTALNLTVLLALLSIPWLVWLGMRWTTFQLNELRISLVKQSKTTPIASGLALLIQKLLPYAHWLVMLFAVYIIQNLLLFTVFSELTFLLPYIRFYIYYRLFRQLMQCDYVWVNRQIRKAKLWQLRKQVDMAARTLGISALIIFSFLSAIESLIRRGLIYHIATIFFLNLGFLIVMGFGYQWREIITAGLTRQWQGKLGQKLAALCRGRWGFFLAIPALLILLALYLLNQLARWGARFELTKRIATEVFRYRLESSMEKETNSKAELLPEEYLKLYALSGVNHEARQVSVAKESEEILPLLKLWQDDKATVRSIALIGHKGSGKTNLLEHIALMQTPGKRVIRLTISEKMVAGQSLLQQLNDVFGIVIDDSLAALNNINEKIVVLVDDAHNLFLSQRDGFHAFQLVLGLIGLPNKNLFWCFAFNHFSWAYLNSVNARHQYFGKVIALSPWTEKSIQGLILSIHAQSHFNLVYDDILQAAGTENDTENVTYIENRFFSLLRQQSRGNPRLAVYLWLSALHKVGAKDLKVGLPEDPDNVLLATLPEDALFILASIIRHENLSLPQTFAVTQLPEGVVRHILERLVGLKLLDCDQSGVYRLAILYQYPIIQYLLAKHCLYE